MGIIYLAHAHAHACSVGAFVESTDAANLSMTVTWTPQATPCSQPIRSLLFVFPSYAFNCACSA